ncbi:glycosyltransferase family 4 protein [Candidatus Pelagibacter communis]|uniref:glycosyltransferase family 4 protein n=1 Tax=Pelagibacter ubique TaxID=198252 RepID=UPI00094C6BB5|nr:glycosyltransferase family 4 protein [Candidatus Pelagibacter ubique]
MKISVLLPYKENFSENYAGAVSLFVKDTIKNSKYFKSTYIFGNTNYKKPFLKNYINVFLKKNIFQSSSKIYVNEFLKIEKKINSDIIEVHNRPNYIKYLKTTKKKLILYFHNDPLSMTGSTLLKDRIFLLNHIDKIIFNSSWSQKRFFIDIDNKDLLKQKTAVCFQSTSKTKINFSEKKKIISFIGKLNSAKGYDLFGKAMMKILSEFKDWKAVVYGDEPRENILFQHKNLIINGYTKHEKILNFLKKVSISVVCSRWEEPFGRTSLEAASRGSAVIISNRGGLPETTNSAIILKKLSSNEIYNEIKRLITNKKKLVHLQKKNYRNFRFNHKYISDLIDNIRSEFISNKKLNFFRNKTLKVMHITNFNERFDGRLHYNTGRRLNNGFIRNGHNVLTISDRDIIHNNKSIKDPKGQSSLDRKIIESFNNFKPDLVVLGHADRVSKETLVKMKNFDKNLKISQWFLDPLSKYGPDHENNKKRILDKIDIIDNSFLTTDPKSLSFNVKNSNYMPNPCDEAFETLSNYEKNCNFDVFFAMSHGVHRGSLKVGKNDDREFFINKLIKLNQNLKFDVYGMNNVQPIWAENFINKISNSYMGLNLSRGKPIKYYSSDRLVQIIGNGLLTFVDEKTQLSDFFDDNEMIFYKDINDLSYKLNKYKKDVRSGKKIAKNGKKKYFKYFNSSLVSEYIISKTFNIKSKYKFVW